MSPKIGQTRPAVGRGVQGAQIPIRLIDQYVPPPIPRQEFGAGIQRGLAAIQRMRDEQTEVEFEQKVAETLGELGRWRMEAAISGPVALTELSAQQWQNRIDPLIAELPLEMQARARLGLEPKMQAFITGALEIEQRRTELRSREVLTGILTQAQVEAAREGADIEEIEQRVGNSIARLPGLTAEERQRLARESLTAIQTANLTGRLHNGTTRMLALPYSPEAEAIIPYIIYQESRGNPRARSPVGALGLMQVMPPTGLEVLGKIDRALYKEIKAINNPERQAIALERALLDPDINLRVGTAYFNYLLQRFDGDVEAALIGYNGGPRAALRFLRSGRNYAAIPAEETRNYVRSILREMGAMTSEFMLSNEIQIPLDTRYQILGQITRLRENLNIPNLTQDNIEELVEQVNTDPSAYHDVYDQLSQSVVPGALGQVEELLFDILVRHDITMTEFPENAHVDNLSEESRTRFEAIFKKRQLTTGLLEGARRVIADNIDNENYPRDFRVALAVSLPNNISALNAILEGFTEAGIELTDKQKHALGLVVAVSEQPLPAGFPLHVFPTETQRLIVSAKARAGLLPPDFINLVAQRGISDVFVAPAENLSAVFTQTIAGVSETFGEIPNVERSIIEEIKRAYELRAQLAGEPLEGEDGLFRNIKDAVRSGAIPLDRLQQILRDSNQNYNLARTALRRQLQAQNIALFENLKEQAVTGLTANPERPFQVTDSRNVTRIYSAEELRAMGYITAAQERSLNTLREQSRRQGEQLAAFIENPEPQERTEANMQMADNVINFVPQGNVSTREHIAANNVEAAFPTLSTLWERNGFLGPNTINQLTDKVFSDRVDDRRAGFSLLAALKAQDPAAFKQQFPATVAAYVQLVARNPRQRTDPIAAYTPMKPAEFAKIDTSFLTNDVIMERLGITDNQFPIPDRRMTPGEQFAIADLLLPELTDFYKVAASGFPPEVAKELLWEHINANYKEWNGSLMRNPPNANTIPHAGSTDWIHADILNAVATRIGPHEGTVVSWENGKTVPNPESYFMRFEGFDPNNRPIYSIVAFVRVVNLPPNIDAVRAENDLYIVRLNDYVLPRQKPDNITEGMLRDERPVSGWQPLAEEILRD